MTKEELKTDESKYIIELVIKDKLKKEAEEWLCNNLHSASEEDFIKAMVDIAEPREKRIAELERKLEQTEKDLADYQFNYPTIKELQKENADLKEEINKIAFARGNLEEENAELKSENQKWKDEWQEQVQKATDEGYARTLQTIQLTKAKELLNEFMRISKASDEDFEHDYSELIAEAEQFLNEVEK